MQSHAVSYDLLSRTWASALPTVDSPRTLVLAFGAPEMIDRPDAFAELARAYPRSLVIGCSSAGEIHGTQVRDHSLAVSVTKFDNTELQLASLDVQSATESFASGAALAKRLVIKPGLRAVLILSEGLHVNGSELIRGLNSVLDENIVVTGGLSGDGSAFKRTWVAVGAKLRSDVVAAVGFYGDHVVVGHGSKGGWDKFGPERVVTRSEGNVLYELDGKPALQIYQEYLGDKAKDLPSSGLLFPLALRVAGDEKFVVRTLLSIDRAQSSLTFAGDVPKGQLAQLMKADFDRLIDGAGSAGEMTLDGGALPPNADALVVAISCVGRRLVLGPRIEEEVEAVRDALGSERAKITGFYSYGEISPYAKGHCDLHNQTMTLTTFRESVTPLAPLAVGRAARGSVTGMPKLDDTNTEVSALPSPGFTVAQLSYDQRKKAWSAKLPPLDSPRTLVLGFGAPELIDQPEAFGDLARAYPRSLVIGCSSAGEIHGTHVRDHSLAVSVTRFEKTDLQLASLDVRSPTESYSTGAALAKRLVTKPGLRAVLILSEGLHVNGSELIRGLNEILDPSIVVTGGLSGDGSEFKRTWVAVGGKLRSDVVAAVGFYGDHLVVSHGSKGGWDKFGPERVVTRAEGNVLYELDGRPALQIYQEYLGDKAKDLPASGLLFPLALRNPGDEKFVVRTLLAIDRAQSSLTFAGDVPKGQLAQLMKADFDRLIDGAGAAAEMTKQGGALPVDRDALVVAISCVGRRLVLGPRIEEEVEAVRDALGTERAKLTGFYSYGEISPYAKGHCDLHNQTMTLTTFTESPTPLPALRATGIAARGSRPAITAALTTTPRTPAPRVTPRSTVTPLSIEIPSVVMVPPPLPQRAALALPGTPIVRIPRANSSDATTEITRHGELTLVRLRGRLTESFKGDALGRSLSGRVVFDLGEVDRVTSFGVREWLAMFGVAGLKEAHFIRCSESIVNQLSMIRKFDGGAHIVSFYAPYLCTGCGIALERLVDCERDEAEVASALPVSLPCTRCSSEARFDDDARSYFAFATPHLGGMVPADVRALHDSVLARPEEQVVDEIEKSFDGDATRIHVAARLGARLRWARLLDGIEGTLVIDLGDVPGYDPAGLQQLVQAIASVSPAVTRIEIEQAPAMVVERFLDLVRAPGARVAVTSMTVPAYCGACAVQRPANVKVHQYLAELAAGHAYTVACKRCSSALQLVPDAMFEALCAAQAPAVPAPVVAAAAVMPQASTGSRSTIAIAVATAAVAIAITVGIVMSRGSQRPPVAAVAPTVTAPVTLPVAAETPKPAWQAQADLPPAWVEQPFAIEGDQIFVVGHAVVTDEAVGLEAARKAATVGLVDQLYADLEGSRAYKFLSTRVRRDAPEADQVIAQRFAADHARDIAFERIEATTRAKGTATEVYARYRLSKKQYDQLVASYRESSKFRGIEVARVFPSLATALHTDGQLVITSVDKRSSAEAAGLREGDIVRGVGTSQPTTPEEFRQMTAAAWVNVPARGKLELVVESVGATRTVALFKPAPQQP